MSVYSIVIGFLKHNCLHHSALLYTLQNSMVILTNKNVYLRCTFVLSTLGTEQR